MTVSKSKAMTNTYTDTDREIYLKWNRKYTMKTPCISLAFSLTVSTGIIWYFLSVYFFRRPS